jgi:ribosome-binding protein aMBF1 (putative translation factor)
MPKRNSKTPRASEDLEYLGPRAFSRMQRSITLAGNPSLAHQVELALVLYRDARRMSQQQLAERLGVKQPQVARLESGLVNPTMDTLLRISERLGIEFTLEIGSDGLTVRYVLPD